MKTVRYHILLALAGGAVHGAEIRRRVKEHSGGSVTLYPAMLYGSLDDLTRAGWITEVHPEAGQEQPRWRFYELTPEGARALEAETARLEALVARARARIEAAARG